MHLGPKGLLLLLCSCINAHPTQQPSDSISLTRRSQSAFSFPLSNGFPNIKIPSAALSAIESQAHGTLPNTPPPTSIADISAIIWQLIAFNEIFEVAFFTSLIQNITDQAPGYSIGSQMARNAVLADLEAIVAQEQLHALGANAILSNSGHTTIQACEYVFPSSDFDSAITFASTFTDIVLGTLQEALQNFAIDGDGPDFIGLLGSIIGQEGEQNGLFRSVSPGRKIASALPFLTEAAGTFAFSALNQMVVVPGSCPNANVIQIPIFEKLNVDTQNIGPSTSTIQFSFSSNDTDTSTLSLVYINQQNVPVVEKLQNVKIQDQLVTFTAAFPYAEFEMNGLTLAAVTECPGPFANATEVALSTKFGPGIIEIN